MQKVLSGHLLISTGKITHGSNSMSQACKVGSKQVCMKEVSLLCNGAESLELLSDVVVQVRTYHRDSGSWSP